MVAELIKRAEAAGPRHLPDQPRHSRGHRSVRPGGGDEERPACRHREGGRRDRGRHARHDHRWARCPRIRRREMFLGLDLGTSGAQGPPDGRRPEFVAEAIGAAEREPPASRLVRAEARRLDRGGRGGHAPACRRSGACGGARASACPATCMARRCSTRRTRCCAPASCGTTRAAMRKPRRLDADPVFRRVTGNIVFPGFTAPKLAWVQRQRAGAFRRDRARCCCRRTTCASG